MMYLYRYQLVILINSLMTLCFAFYLILPDYERMRVTVAEYQLYPDKKKALLQNIKSEQNHPTPLSPSLTIQKIISIIQQNDLVINRFDFKKNIATDGASTLALQFILSASFLDFYYLVNDFKTSDIPIEVNDFEFSVDNNKHVLMLTISALNVSLHAHQKPIKRERSDSLFCNDFEDKV